jgi:hypothetical protein
VAPWDRRLQPKDEGEGCQGNWRSLMLPFAPLCERLAPTEKRDGSRPADSKTLGSYAARTLSGA